MAALRWDEQSGAFVETTNAPMRYDSESGAWVETTGMAWDEKSQAWTERWNTGVSAYVYGAANETVTIKKNGIIVATVATNSAGCSNEKISLGYGTYTLTGSGSGWTEEQTVDKNTTKFRAMPEGALYWYGSTTSMCGNIVASTYGVSNINKITYIAPILAYNTNSLNVRYKPDQSAYCSGSVYFGTTPKVYDGYTKICMEYDNYVTDGGFQHTANVDICIGNAYGNLHQSEAESDFIGVGSTEPSDTLKLALDNNYKYPVILFSIYNYTGYGSLSFNVKKLWLE